MDSIVSIALMAAQMKAASLSQGIGVAVASHQAAQDRSVVDLLAGATASAPAPAPAGQGTLVDVQV